MMIHTSSQPEMKKAGVSASNNGCIVKTVRYIGRASHAGGAPHLGVNALYAANIGLIAINALRETFRDEDSIRVHPIITHGGSQVNVIPGRGAHRDLRARQDGGGDPRRQPARGPCAAGGGARAGRPGRDRDAAGLPAAVQPRRDGADFKANAAALLGADQVTEAGHRSGSTDMGDISHVMPTLHPYMGGASGSGHGADFAIADPALAYVEPAKQLALMAVDMLWGNAEAARDVLADLEAADDEGGVPRLSAGSGADRALRRRRSERGGGSTRRGQTLTCPTRRIVDGPCTATRPPTFPAASSV